MDITSVVPGETKKSCVIRFCDNDVWLEELGELYEYEEIALDKLTKDIEFLKCNEVPKYACVNMEDTIVTDRIIIALVNALLNSIGGFKKICFIGVDRKSASKIKMLLGSSDVLFEFADSLEGGKVWFN